MLRRSLGDPEPARHQCQSDIAQGPSGKNSRHLRGGRTPGIQEPRSCLSPGEDPGRPSPGVQESRGPEVHDAKSWHWEACRGKLFASGGAIVGSHCPVQAALQSVSLALSLSTDGPGFTASPGSGGLIGAVPMGISESRSPEAQEHRGGGGRQGQEPWWGTSLSWSGSLP